MENVNTKCTVVMDGEARESTDFVAILSKDNGDASVLYNTDALTLGMAIKILAKEFVRCMNELSDDERKEVEAVLGDAFAYDIEEVSKDEEN